MKQANTNIDFCGIRNLLRQLSGQGFTEKELKKSRTGSPGVQGLTSFFVDFHHSVSIAIVTKVW